MVNKLKRVLKTFKMAFVRPQKKFDLTGERVDILYNKHINFESLDLYQKSHYRRYEFALSLIDEKSVCGDFACGTGYGSAMLALKAATVIGADINMDVIADITNRYRRIRNVRFIQADLLTLSFENFFDTIVSFETIEHFKQENVLELLCKYHKSLKPRGRVVFSTPYLQPRNEAALALGHHLTFYIDENMISKWLSQSGFQLKCFMYQNYDTHLIEPQLDKKDFIIGVAQKIG